MRSTLQIQGYALCFLLRLVAAHSDHTFDLNDENDAGMSYAERHMHTEHHIDSFDLESFFKLHDLNLDGVWDRAEIEAVYGLHHHSVADKAGAGKDARTEGIVNQVLEKLDRNRDGRITLQEFIDGGQEGLPSFEGYKDLGHHYDEESEYFLHHEELYHNTPETQTDEAYNHPEDLEHFKHHAHIEAEEDARERKFEGLSPEADLSKDHVIGEDALADHAHAPGEGPPPPGYGGEAQQVFQPGEEVPPPDERERMQREDKDSKPNRMGINDEEIRARWEKAKNVVKGERRRDHSKNRNDEQRIRSGYKAKFRKGLRSDEF